MRDEIAVSATGILADFIEAQMIGWADFHVAERLSVAASEQDNANVKLALALTMRSLREGSTLLDLPTAHLMLPEGVEPVAPTDLAWPDIERWLTDLAASTLVALPTDPTPRPLRLDGDRLYLERYWQAEQSVARRLKRRWELPELPHGAVAADPTLSPAQMSAVAAATIHRTTVIIGGPGTGKTHTVSSLLEAFAHQPTPPRSVAIAAPTGKAAARLEEAVSKSLSDRSISVPKGTTLHKLLGAHPAKPHRPRFNANFPLPHDLVVVDETSMMSLSMMGQLLDALADDARLVLVGDSNQLASVDAGAVLADLVDADGLLAPPGDRSAVVELTQNFRFRQDTPIAALAAAIVAGDEAAALAALATKPDLVRLEPIGNPATLADMPGLSDEIETNAELRVRAAKAGDGLAAVEALEAHRMLCAHRTGTFGEAKWNRILGQRLTALNPSQDKGEFHVGQPLLVTRNSDAIGREWQVWNGDSGVVTQTSDGPRVAIGRGSWVMLVPPQLLEGVADLYAMTIHKSQGSQFDKVSILLPPIGSPLLTRELLYTAVTRARAGLVIYGQPGALEHAIATPARRATGLAR